MLKIILLFIGNVVCNSAGNLLMKIGMKKTDGVNLASVEGVVRALVLNSALVTGVLFYAASLLSYIFILKKIDLSIAYPISVSSAIIVVTALSSVLLKENISVQQVIGSAIILFGIFILTR